MSNSRPAFRQLLIASIFVLAAGCSRSPTTVPVRGIVTLDGVALADAEVTFVPDVSAGSPSDNASGFTDAKGEFTLTVGRTRKAGAVPGTYRVIITDTSSVSDLTTPAAIGAGGGLDTPAQPSELKRARLPVVYSDQSRTPLTGIAVKAGSELLRFDIQSTQH